MKNLIIKDLHASVEGKEILKGINLQINEGETLAILGPNGHGKSTLLSCIMGNPRYEVTAGSIYLDGIDILSLPVDERSKQGLFLAMQYPSEVPGVVNSDFLKMAMNAHREKPISLFDFFKKIETNSTKVNIPLDMASRHLNEGFSGGEKKRNEILQMLLLNPTFAMLDEIDSGLDVDALKIVASAIEEKEKEGMSFVVVSHYARLYEMINPTRAAIIVNGQVAVEGGKELISRVDKEGYEWLKYELGIEVQKEENIPISLGSCAVKEATKGK